MTHVNSTVQVEIYTTATKPNALAQGQPGKGESVMVVAGAGFEPATFRL